jgi:hypothetical protein
MTDIRRAYSIEIDIPAAEKQKKKNLSEAAYVRSFIAIGGRQIIDTNPLSGYSQGLPEGISTGDVASTSRE